MLESIAIDRMTTPAGIAGDPGAGLRVSGAVTTSTDGSVFDAVFAWTPGGTDPVTGGLFDLAAGGLRVVEAHPEAHAYVLAPHGDPGPACVAAGVASPCLVPRLPALAHARLRTAREFAGTLSGSVSVAMADPPSAPGWVEWAERATPPLAAIALVLVLAIVARRRAGTPLARVRSEARRALRATRSDATLRGVRAQIAVMLEHAIALDVARRACARRLGALRPIRGDAPAIAPWFDAERAEAGRLERDRAASLAGLARIEAALRWVTVRTRARRDEPTTPPPADPAESLVAELALRDHAIDEANALTER
jgi:hypothetical protein